MNREIFESLERSPLDTEEISKIHEKVVACIDLGGSIINEVSEMCEDQQCHTAFYVIFKYQGESTSMVLEISKLGPFAKIYWFKKRFRSKEYFDAAPSQFWDEQARKIGVCLAKKGIRVLKKSELIEDVSDIISYQTPVGPAETVDDVLFFFDGRHV